MIQSQPANTNKKQTLKHITAMLWQLFLATKTEVLGNDELQ